MEVADKSFLRKLTLSLTLTTETNFVTTRNYKKLIVFKGNTRLITPLVFQ